MQMLEKKAEEEDEPEAASEESGLYEA